ncbi:hypothetical protein [Xylanibacter muris]|uniref:Uncharacterized protein n=1 Tax=Xylanibacter muris TaxID=2736290 RepID=A0ABX2AND9_9BACT|nr:hypothetical protein [Xylanibacter muris]NPD92731.1 hypothetical protein [Xylanibacter muris]
MNDKKMFLLGGNDLEMETISRILKENDISFRDRCLSWNEAYLSRYKTELDEFGGRSGYIIYGVELQEDIGCPCNYVRIDHHNDYAHRPSSIEQVMGILNIPMERYHKLVSANDAHYIQGMIDEGATQAEIKHIRYADRKAQGVTENDEMLAVKAIEGKSQYGSLTVVNALSSAFSPICDRLYPYKNLLIYTKDELVFYGEGTAKLKNMFHDYINERKMYYGGGENGYLGMVKGVFTADDIKRIVDEIKILFI